MNKLPLVSIPILLCISLVSALKVISPYSIPYDSTPMIVYSHNYCILTSVSPVTEEAPPSVTVWTEAMYIESDKTSGDSWSCIDCSWSANSYVNSHGTNIRRSNSYPDSDSIAFTTNTTGTYYVCFDGYESDHLGYFNTVITLNDTSATSFTWVDTGVRKPGGDITGWWFCEDFSPSVAQQSYSLTMATTPAHSRGIMDVALVTNNLTLVNSLNATWSVADNTTELTAYSYLEGD